MANGGYVANLPFLLHNFENEKPNMLYGQSEKACHQGWNLWLWRLLGHVCFYLLVYEYSMEMFELLCMFFCIITLKVSNVILVDRKLWQLY